MSCNFVLNSCLQWHNIKSFQWSFSSLWSPYSWFFQYIAHLVKTFDVVICDVSGHVNLAFRMIRSTFLEVRVWLWKYSWNTNSFPTLNFMQIWYTCESWKLFETASTFPVCLFQSLIFLFANISLFNISVCLFPLVPYHN
jgi:hypothetical protein